MAKNKRMKVRNNINFKLTFVLFALVASFVVLGAKIFYLKTVLGEEYEKASKAQQVNRYDTIISPNRGTITDRNLQTLAVSTTVYNIILDPLVLIEYSEDEQHKTIDNLSRVLNLDYNVLKDYVTINAETGLPNANTHWKILAKQVDKSVKEELEALNLKGVVYNRDTKRSYSVGTLASQVIGFIRGVKWGLESQYDTQLSGVSGRSFITYDETGNLSSQEIDAINGNTIVTTLDYTIQQYAEEAAAEAMEIFSAETTGVVIMNPNTAEILAMAENPTFNPNDPATPVNLGEESFDETWEYMDEAGKFEYLNRVWKNFNVTSTYEPGSIFKPIVVAAALEEGIIKPTDTFYCGGSKEVAGEIISCHKKEGHGLIDVEHALSESCNVALMDIGEKLGAEIFYKYQKDFGMGEKTGIDLPAEADARTLMYHPEKIGAVELATMSFGQSFNCTSIQILTAFAAAINGGDLMRPYVVSQVINEQGTVIKENKPEVVRKVISEETSDIVRGFLRTTIEEGTGKKAKIEGYYFGGKTGTAQQGVRSEEDQDYTLAFVSFLPADNPQYIAIIVAHKPGNYIEGATSLSPVVKNLMTNIIKYKSIAPSYATEEVAVASKSVKLSDYTGLSLKDVLPKVKALGLDYEVTGSGNIIENQVPKGGTIIDEGSKILFYAAKGSGEGDIAVVPKVVGLSYDEAVYLITSRGLEVVISGDDSGNVISQSPLYGVSVDKGSDIKITLKSPDGTS